MVDFELTIVSILIESNKIRINIRWNGGNTIVGAFRGNGSNAGWNRGWLENEVGLGGGMDTGWEGRD